MTKAIRLVCESDPLLSQELPIVDHVKRVVHSSNFYVGVHPTAEQEPSTPKQFQSAGRRLPDPEISVGREQFEGNPLECPFDLNLLGKQIEELEEPSVCNFSEGLYQPLSVDDARALLTKGFETGEDTFSIYYCDASDPARVLLLGQQNVPGIRGSFVTSYPFESDVVRDDPRISVDNQRKYQLSLSRSGRIESQVWSKYILYSSKGIDASKGNSLVLECSWSDPRATLEPPPMTAKVKVKVAIYPEAKDSIAISLWKQLRHLGTLVEALTTGELVWISDGPRDSVDQLLIDFIEKGHMGRILSSETSDGYKEMFGAVGVGFALERQKTDIIDFFWNVMLECTCYEELKSGLKYLMNSTREGKAKINVSSIGKTLLGKLISKNLRSSHVPELTGLEPLELLVDSGLEKMKRDYLHAFLTPNLSSKEKLASVLPESSTFSDYKQYAQATLRALYRLHMSLEVTSLALKNLRMPQIRAALVVDNVFSKIQMDGTTSADVEFEVRANLLSEVLKNDRLEPWIWQTVLSSEAPKKEVTTSWSFSLADVYDQETTIDGRTSTATSTEVKAKYACMRSTYVKLKFELNDQCVGQRG